MYAMCSSKNLRPGVVGVSATVLSSRKRVAWKIGMRRLLAAGALECPRERPPGQHPGEVRAVLRGREEVATEREPLAGGISRGGKGLGACLLPGERLLDPREPLRLLGRAGHGHPACRDVAV